MISDREELKKLIPFYLNGTLSDNERKRVEEALEQDPEMEKELLEFSRIKEVIETEPAPEPPGYLFNKILNRVESDKTFVQKMKGILEHFCNSRAIPWGLVTAQALIILFLFFRPVSPTYKTLSVFPSHEGAYINVIFKEDIREKEMRTLLNRVGATIVEGPTREGLYILKLADREEIKAALQILKESGKVKFVAKAYR